MNIKYTVKVILKEKKEPIILGQLVKSVRGWIGYFGMKENSYENECNEISVCIVSDEEIKVGDKVISTEHEAEEFTYDITCPLKCYKSIGKAPQNIIVDLISGIKKEDSEVMLATNEYDFLLAPIVSYEPQIDENGEVYCF